MSERYGFDCKLYRNTGTYGSPTWNEMPGVTDVSLNLESSTPDLTTRGDGGYKISGSGLKDAGIEFSMVWDPADADFAALLTAFTNRATVEVAALDGPVGTSGTQGLRATMRVTKFSREEKLDDAVRASVTLKPARADNAPSWMVVA